LVIGRVIQFKADVIVLDLRLHEIDFVEGTSIEDITGYKVLQQIKKINKGIQVIIFSATNKIWNLQALQAAEADGFIIKESPENSVDENFTNQSIENIYKIIDLCLKRSFLKKIDTYISNINKLISRQKLNLEEYSDFISRTKSNLEVAFHLFYNLNDFKYKNYGYLQLFQVIEDFIRLKNVFEEGNLSYVFCKEKKVLVLQNLDDKISGSKKFKSVICFNEHKHIYEIKDCESLRRPDTYYKISALLIFRYGITGIGKTNWNKINKNRNDVAHGEPNVIVSENDIIQIFDFLILILDKNKQNDRNINNLITESKKKENHKTTLADVNPALEELLKKMDKE